MKKLLFVLTLLVSYPAYTQYTKKQLKKLKKMELKIVNRGLDLGATFVPYFKKVYLSDGSVSGKDIEPRWAQSLFEMGLEVGDYSSESQVKDADNREMNVSKSLIFNGRYVFDCNTRGSIKIQDLQSKNKIVAIISYKTSIRFGSNSYKREYIIRELIKSNKQSKQKDE